MAKASKILAVAAVGLFGVFLILIIALGGKSKTGSGTGSDVYVDDVLFNLHQSTLHGAEREVDEDSVTNPSSYFDEPLYDVDYKKIKHHVLVNKANPGGCPITHLLVDQCSDSCTTINRLKFSVWADGEVALLKLNASCLEIQKEPRTAEGCKYDTSLAKCDYEDKQVFWFATWRNQFKFRLLAGAFRNDNSCKGLANSALRLTKDGTSGFTLTVEPVQADNDEFLWKRVKCTK